MAHQVNRANVGCFHAKRVMGGAHLFAALAMLFLAAPRLAIAANVSSGRPIVSCINGPGACNPGAPASESNWNTVSPSQQEQDEIAGLYGYNSGAALDFSNGNIFNPGHYDAFSFNNHTASTVKRENRGNCLATASDPVVVADGAKVLSIPLFQLPGEMGLKYALYYHSVTSSSYWAHNPWASSISYALDLYCGFTDPNVSCNEVTLYRSDGSSISFTGNHASYGNFPEIGGGGLATLVHNSDGTWTLHDEDTTTQTYDQYGDLTSIKDVSGIHQRYRPEWQLPSMPSGPRRRWHRGLLFWWMERCNRGCSCGRSRRVGRPRRVS